MRSRAESERIARELRAEGLRVREIAERMGVSRSAAGAWLSDPGGLRLKARKATYPRDPCVDCGTPTSSGASNGHSAEPLCIPCAGARRKVWTLEAIVRAIQEWAAMYGEPPASHDWDPYNARRMKDEERARRFEDAKGRWPSVTVVIDAFGSWNAAIQAAGFEPRVGHGGAGNQRRRRAARAAA